MTPRNYVCLLAGREHGCSAMDHGTFLLIIVPKIPMVLFSEWWETILTKIQFANSTMRKCLNCYTLIFLRAARMSNFLPFRIGRLAFGIECN